MENASISLEGSSEDNILIKIADLPAIHCPKKHLIEASEYFEALAKGNFKEASLGGVTFALSEWKEEYYSFFCWLSSGIDLLKVINTRSLLFFIILANYFQLKPSYFENINRYSGNIPLLDSAVQSYLMPFWSYRFIPFPTMTTIVLGNQTPDKNSHLVKLVLAWLDESSFEDRRELESSEAFHQVRDFLRTLQSWMPTNLGDLLGVIESYPYASQAIELVPLLSHMKPVCFCTRYTPQILIKYN
mmetsp:Transcript_13938/g.20389  ORF Transcript_13938/g.20389 Transcript_13938/m.20389 type:complete len:245 (+) Transcript_13938:21-755(+)